MNTPDNEMTQFELLAAIDSTAREIKRLEARRKELIILARKRHRSIGVMQLSEASNVSRPTIYAWERSAGLNNIS